MLLQTHTVYWLGESFHLLLSATLLYNSHDNIQGYMPLLFSIPSIWMYLDWSTLGVSHDDNIFQLPRNHTGLKLYYSTEAVEEYVLKKEVPNDVSGDHLHLVLNHFMIRHNLSS